MSLLISIVTPNYNCAKFIAQTINSVLAQTYTNWEMLIVDDCSTDGSYEIALDYAKKDSRIKVFRNEKNSGAAVSRNRAIKESKGEYLAFLDSDDLWKPEKLKTQLVFMQKNNCSFSFTEYEHIDENGNPLHKRARVIKKFGYKKYLFHCWTGCLTVMFKQDVNHKIYGPNVKNNNDYALFLEVLKDGRKAFGIKETFAFYRIHTGSISRNKFKKIKPYITVLNKYNHIPKIFCYFFLFTNQLIKKVWKYLIVL